MRTGMAVIATALAFVTSGCATEETPSTGDLFQEYIRSGDVQNDRFPGGSGEDRIANLASRWSVEEFQAVLFGTYECDDTQVATRCALTSEATKAAQDFAGPNADPLGRSILVKHEDGPLELVTLYVVEAPSGEARLIDKTGRTYTDLTDFRTNNDLLTASDTMLTLRNITSIPGEGDLVTVTGHTPSPVWQWWLLGGIAALATLGITIATRRRTTARNQATADAFHPEETSATELTEDNRPADHTQHNPPTDPTEENPTAGLAEQNPATGLAEENRPTSLAEETPATDSTQENPPADLAEETPATDRTEQNQAADRTEQNSATDRTEENPATGLAEETPPADLTSENPGEVTPPRS